jgi:hypothetical protein
MDSGNWISPEVGNQGACVVQVESSKLLPILVILAILCGLSIGLAVFAFSASRNADREARMLEYYLLELDAKFINAGLKDPAESIANKLKQRQEVKK